MEEWEEEVDPFKVVGCERSDKVGGRKDVCNLLCCIEGGFPGTLQPELLSQGPETKRIGGFLGIIVHISDIIVRISGLEGPIDEHRVTRFPKEPA